MFRAPNLTRERVVFLPALVLEAVFGALLPDFSMPEYLPSLVRVVSVLGMLGVAMALVVIGRSIDLSLVSLMAISVARTFQLAAKGMPLVRGLVVDLAFSLVFGTITGFLIACTGGPTIFATAAQRSDRAATR